MIIKANQRGNARELARHLLNTHDNERVEIHAINGLIGETVEGALAEMEAVARGTKCTQPLFSVSLNPPQDASASIEDFEDAVSRIAAKNGLENQPYVMVFHEKEGRRHCHAVFSRINVDEMKAINLPFYKNKCMDISIDLFLEHGWKLPQGFIDRELRNPLNFSLEQWQQAKRLGDDPRLIKQALTDCFEHSDNKPAFEQALKERGFYLAWGDRRGFVAVDWRGEVFSLSRWTSFKRKELQNKLGDPKDLPSVDDIKSNIGQKLAQRIKDFVDILNRKHEQTFAPIYAQKQAMTNRHTQMRDRLNQDHEQRRFVEAQERQARFTRGLTGLWHRISGKHREIRQQNEMEALQSFREMQAEKDDLILRQLDERQPLQDQLSQAKEQNTQDIEDVRRAVFKKLPDDQILKFEPEFEQRLNQTQTYNMEM
ncbi:MAG: relaxase/mobilization nuclease domain-containing protein [bacterium]|nr:relaxase/mobilization nuclease domain-containing protein [bacterium]